LRLELGRFRFDVGATRATKASIGHPRDPVIAGWLEDMSSGDDTGESVTPDSAMRLSAVFAAVNLLSSTFLILPPIVYRRLAGTARERDPDHYLHDVLRDQPNRFQTGEEFREMQMIHFLMRGNSYSEIIATGGDPVAELVPLHPDHVTAFWAPDGRRAYDYRPYDKPARVILQSEMHHVMDYSLDGLRGLTRITQHRLAVGKYAAVSKYGARVFKNDARPGYVLEHPGKLSVEAQDRLIAQQERRHGGERQHSVGVLEEGMKVQEIGITPVDAQHIETLKMSIADIARIFNRVPLHMLGELERATYSNIEEQALEYVIYSLMPFLKKFEGAIKRDLMTPTGRKTHYVEYLVDALLRGDTKSRYEALFRAVGGPWMTRDEARKIENLKAEGLDKVLQPVNMVESGAEGADTQARMATALDQVRLIGEAFNPEIAQQRDRIGELERELELAKNGEEN